MTQVDFYHGAQDKLAAACKLVGEAFRQRRSVVVYAPDPATSAQIDRVLWTQPAIGFVPHVAAESPLAGETPVILARNLANTIGDQVLVNLSPDTPQGYARFERLVEIVGTDEDDRVKARARYKFYRDRGYPLQAFDLGTASQ